MTDSAGKLAVIANLENEGSLTTTGLMLPTDCSYEMFETIGRGLSTMHEAMRWAIGDWLQQGETLFSDAVYQAAEAMGLSVASRMQYVRVAERIPVERRIDNLTWSHHRAVVGLASAGEQDLWLRRALESGWSSNELEQHLREQKEEGNQTVVREHTRRVGIAEAALEVYRQATKEDLRYVVPLEPMEQLREALEIVEAA